MTTYLIEDSFTGFLSAVFDKFERREEKVKIALPGHSNFSLFDATHTVEACQQKMKRVADGIAKKAGKAALQDVYAVFLSEDVDMWNDMLYILTLMFSQEADILNNYGDEKVMRFHTVLKMVHRERHRMKAFIRFKKSADGLFFAVIEPDFNVLPLITGFFKTRYADQPWLIYDEKRKYGCYYDLHKVEEISLLPQQETSEQLPAMSLVEDELLYENLWKDYFKSTNIESRKNLKLHLQKVPKRYWHLLPEKQ